jgi:autotransporter-associated beta strand protein
MAPGGLSFHHFVSFFIFALAPALLGQASGTWINATANSTWGTAANWAGGVVASGVDATADFSTLDIAAARTVSLGGSFAAGTLVFGDSTTPSSNWTLANGTGGPWALTLAVSSGSPVVGVVNQTATISAVLAGSQGFTKTGTGVLTLTGANTFTGGINLSAGTLNFSNGSLGGNVVDFTANAVLGWNGTNTQDVSAQIKIEDGVTATIATGANNVIFASALQAGTGGITKTGVGTLTITAANTFTGATRVNVGRIVLSGGANRLASTGTIGLGQGANAGVLQLGDAGGAADQSTASLTIAGTAAANAVVGGYLSVSTLTINNAAAVTYAGLLGGAGSNENNLALTKSGAGTLTLNNAGNSFWGDVVVAGGTLAVTKPTALGSTPKTVTVSGTLNAPSLKLDGTGGDLGLPATLSLVTSNDNATVPAILSSAGNNVVGGSIALATGGFGGGNTRIKVSGGSLTLNGNIAPAAGTAGSVVLLLDAAAGLTGTVNGVIADNGAALALTRAGSGVWVLTAPNTFTGAVTISGGTLQVASIAAIGTPQPLGAGTGAISLGAGAVAGTLEYTGSADATLARGITAAAAGGGIIRNSGGAVLTLSGTQAKNGRPLTYTGGSFRITGKITGAAAGDLIFDNANVTLTGAQNTFVGTTLIKNNSTLVVMNTGGSATGTGSVVVDAGSTLAGTGFINAGADNSVIINGCVHVGDTVVNAAASLDLATSGTGSTAFADGSVLEINLYGGAGAGDSSANTAAADVLRVSGTLSIADGATLKLGNPNHLSGWAAGDVLKVFDWSALTASSGVFQIDASSFDFPAGIGLDASALYSTGTLRFTALVVPEPRRGLLLLAGAGFVVLRRGRR